MGDERAITIPPAEYWRFRAAVNEARVIELDARIAADEFKRRLVAADQQARDLFAAMGKTHGFDPSQAYRWRDETCQVVRMDPPAATAPDPT